MSPWIWSFWELQLQYIDIEISSPQLLDLASPISNFPIPEWNVDFLASNSKRRIPNLEFAIYSEQFPVANLHKQERYENR